MNRILEELQEEKEKIKHQLSVCWAMSACVLFSQIDDLFSYTILYTTLLKDIDFNHKGARIEMILTTRFKFCTIVLQQPDKHQQYTTYLTTR